LFDDDATVESHAQSIVQNACNERGLMLQDRNGGDVDETLCDHNILLTEEPRITAMEIQCTYGATSQSQGQTMHRAKSQGNGSWRETRPTLVRIAKFVVDDGDTIGAAVHARTLIRLDLKEFEDPHRLTRGRRELKTTPGKTEQITGR
jgi:hypothetical protein